MRIRIAYSTMLAVLGLVLAVHIHGATAATHNRPGASATIVHVSIKNFRFYPSILTVTVGTTVVWTNKDTINNVPHTVTSNSGLFDSGTIAPTMSYTLTFVLPGTFPYHCRIHPFMKATVKVKL